MKPILGITMGDAAGIGPEIIVKALSDPSIYEICRPVVFGSKGILERAVQIVGGQLRCAAIEQPAQGSYIFGAIDIVEVGDLPADLPLGQVDKRSGQAAYQFIERAVQHALKEEIHGVVTAPLNKEALNLGGCHLPGHTEILAHLSNTKDYAMMLTGGPLKVIHVTTHVSIRKACDLIKRERIERVIDLADSTMKLLGFVTPRIAVAGFNPHCGENGLFGDEDAQEIAPAVAAARQKGLCVSGPISPDTVFYRTAIKNDFDIVVVMYHDQGHIPIKVLGFDTGVNVTVGLPFIRTSVDHGTAFDRAGKGTADCQSMIEAIRLGAQMARTKFSLYDRKV